MKLNVAVQMDPIARINIRGDSTFAMLLEAEKRGHAVSYYTPDRLAQRNGYRDRELKTRLGALNLRAFIFPKPSAILA